MADDTVLLTIFLMHDFFSAYDFVLVRERLNREHLERGAEAGR
jgi:hypothetical protein